MFVLASSHFQKCFSVNAGVWLRMENKFSSSYFQLTMCFSWFDPEIDFNPNFHFKPFPNSRAKRERERETRSLLRPSSNPTTTNRASIRRPTPSGSSIVAPCHTSADQAKIDSNADRLQSPTTHTSADR